MDIQRFRGLAPENKRAPLVLLVGEERFFKEEAIREIERALGPSSARVEFRGPPRGAMESAAVLDELRTASLFSPAKLVLVREAEPFLAEQAEAILAAVRAAPRCATLALDLEKLDRRSAPAKALEKAALMIEAKPLYAEPPPWKRGAPPWDSPLVDWVVRRARERGRRIAPETAYYLTQRTGCDLFEIDSTLEKLSLALDEGAEIEPAGIEALAASTRQGDPFAVADAIGRRDLPLALAAIDRAFRTGIADRRGGRITDAGTIALVVFGRVLSRIGEVRRVRAALDEGTQTSPEKLAQSVGIPPFFAERALGYAERYRGADFRVIYRALLQADLAIKGAGPDPRASLERLAVALCGPAREPALASGLRGM